uniref:Uncharacterized protein n=1 Tax=Lygus hesperus TaxID=30085 RepID=A0A146KP05_LYGHE
MVSLVLQVSLVVTVWLVLPLLASDTVLSDTDSSDTDSSDTESTVERTRWFTDCSYGHPPTTDPSSLPPFSYKLRFNKFFALLKKSLHFSNHFFPDHEYDKNYRSKFLM